MPRVQLIRPDGMVRDGRACRAGDVIEVSDAEAAELLTHRAAALLVRVRMLRPTLVGSVSHAAGDVAEVHPDAAERLIKAGVAALPAIRIGGENVMIAGKVRRPGEVIEVPLADALNHVAAGCAAMADPGAGKEKPRR